MDWTKIFLETFNVSFSTIIKMVYIVVPILIFIECLRDTGWLEKVSRYSQGMTRFMRLPGEAALGIIVGFFVGVVFGSGVILQIREEVKMTRSQLNTLFLFIGICHAVIEETALFTAIGAYGGVLILTRMMMALIFGFTYIWIINLILNYKNRNSQKKLDNFKEV